MVDINSIDPNSLEIYYGWINFALMGLSGLASLLGNRKKKMEQTSTSTQNFNSTETPQLTPQQMQMFGPLLSGLMGRTQGPDLGGYGAAGMTYINQAAGVRNRMLQNSMAARGLSGSPLMASSLMGAEGDRLNALTNFRNTIPEKQWGMQGQALGQLQQLFQSLPFAVNRSGSSTTNTTGTQIQPGNMWGGLFEGLGSGLAAGFGYQDNLKKELERRKQLRTLGVPGGWNAGDWEG